MAPRVPLPKTKGIEEAFRDIRPELWDVERKVEGRRQKAEGIR